MLPNTADLDLDLRVGIEQTRQYRHETDAREPWRGADPDAPGPAAIGRLREHESNPIGPAQHVARLVEQLFALVRQRQRVGGAVEKPDVVLRLQAADRPGDP